MNVTFLVVTLLQTEDIYEFCLLNYRAFECALSKVLKSNDDGRGFSVDSQFAMSYEVWRRFISVLSLEHVVLFHTVQFIQFCIFWRSCRDLSEFVIWYLKTLASLLRKIRDICIN